MAYERELEWNEPPTVSERRYARWAVVRAAGAPAASWWPLARIGAVDLYLAPPGSERDAPTRSVAPVVADKRGRRGGNDYVGVDGDVQTDAYAADAADPIVPPPARPYPPPPAPRVRGGSRVRVAVVDVAFDRANVLPASVEGPIRVGLPGSADDQAARMPALAPGHGTVMAGVVLSQFPDAHVGLFQIESVAGAARPYLASVDLAAAIAVAAGSWQADVVLIAMSEGAWGTPSYLRDVLREAGRSGRRGRGAVLVCSVGDPSANHARQDDSAALGADDLASQPWVQAIGACDSRGGWYRVYPGYVCPGGGPANANGPPGATYNRLGPAVALVAPGEPTRWSEHIAADDSSQSSALAAAAAARVLQENRDLTAAELRALMALTADVPAVVDGGRGLAAGSLDARDRLGHSLKIGHGPVNVRAARLAAVDPFCLALFATRPVPDPPGESRAFALARAWSAEVRRAGAAGSASAQHYARVRRRLSRLFLTSLPVQEAFCWLGRHVRALAESSRVPAWQGQHHGALVERVRHVIDTAWDALGADESDAAASLQALDGAFAGAAAGAAVATVLARVFCPAVMAGDGGQGRARSVALGGDVDGDRRRRRGPHRADGGGEPERLPFARPRVPRPVHRSSR